MMQSRQTGLPGPSRAPGAHAPACGRTRRGCRPPRRLRRSPPHGLPRCRPCRCPAACCRRRCGPRPHPTPRPRPQHRCCCCSASPSRPHGCTPCPGRPGQKPYQGSFPCPQPQCAPQPWWARHTRAAAASAAAGLPTPRTRRHPGLPGLRRGPAPGPALHSRWWAPSWQAAPARPAPRRRRTAAGPPGSRRRRPWGFLLAAGPPRRPGWDTAASARAAGRLSGRRAGASAAGGRQGLEQGLWLARWPPAAQVPPRHPARTRTCFSLRHHGLNMAGLQLEQPVNNSPAAQKRVWQRSNTLPCQGCRRRMYCRCGGGRQACKPSFLQEDEAGIAPARACEDRAWA